MSYLLCKKLPFVSRYFISQLYIRFLNERTSAKLLHTIHLSFQAHSDIMCRRCFSLLDRVDALEVEIQETKDEIVNKYQETVAVHGGRARRRKPATAKKSDYVFPKVGLRDNLLIL